MISHNHRQPNPEQTPRTTCRPAGRDAQIGTSALVLRGTDRRLCAARSVGLGRCYVRFGLSGQATTAGSKRSIVRAQRVRRLVAHGIAGQVFARFRCGEVAARDLARSLAPGGGVELPKHSRVGARFDPSQALSMVHTLKAPRR